MADGKFWRTIGGAVIGAAGSIFAGNRAKKGGEAQAQAAREINAKKLAFQREMWNKTNAYNTPKSQMQRYLAAGLNPNLIYGRGESGNASPMSVPDLDVPDVGAAYRATAGVPSAMLGMTSDVINTQLAQSRRQNIDQDTSNKAIEGTIKAIKAGSNALSYKQQQDTYDTVVETAKKNLARINQDLTLKDRKDSREERITNATINKISKEVANLKKKGKILSSEAIMKRVDVELWRKYRIRPTDPMYMRIGTEIFEGIKDYLGNPVQDR